MNKAMKILVTDDTDANLVLISAVVSKLGHQPIQARNGREAVDLFQAEAPDMILMDVMMPVMDGYQATAEIRKLAGNKWVPVIFLSAKAQDSDLIQGLAVGGDDYLTKPVNLTILQAKIKAMQRIAEMQRVIAENAEQLALYREENEREQDLARHLLERIIRANKFDDQLIERWIRPATTFSGDIIATEFTPKNELYAILADSTGHGLAAALSVLPVIEVFYGMTKKGYGISNIARELNRKIQQLLPMERFVAAVLVAINFSDRTIELWSGGMPTAYFINEHGKILREWHSAHPPLGILKDVDFQAKTETFRWNKPGQLLLYSDGLVEAENAAGERFGTDRLVQALAGKGSDGQFPHLVDAVNTFLELANAADDISVATIRCPMDFVGGNAIPQHHLAAIPVEPSESKLAIKLCAAELKSFDVLPWLISWLNKLYFSPRQCQELFLILSELYNNALDHGILGLDSSLKSQADGFGRYLDVREERLASLQHGIIEIELERLQENQIPYLKLQVRDSGNGFAAETIPNTDVSSRTVPAGRGIALVKTLCAKVEFQDKGNKVVALYQLR